MIVEETSTVKVDEVAVVEEKIDWMDSPKRLDGESFDQYRSRRCKQDVLLREYMQGKRVG